MINYINHVVYVCTLLNTENLQTPFVTSSTEYLKSQTDHVGREKIFLTLVKALTKHVVVMCSLP